ncbi:MAG: substrate-binding domain-containing protein, partial [Verrucomicrobiae bacterium]|nr:substrate-binding domain-containing protein [Verrucomicrobiae bacterium]
NVQKALHSLWHLGYRRPALVISRWYDRTQGFALRGGYLAEQFELAFKQRLPPFLYEEFHEGTIPELGGWLERWRPDAIICADSRVAGALERLGYRIPETMGLAHLSLADDVKGWSGIDEQHELIGSAAVDLIVSQLEHNERGLPANPRCVLIDGIWVNGSTTRRSADRM